MYMRIGKDKSGQYVLADWRKVDVATVTYGTRRVDTVNTATKPLHGAQDPTVCMVVFFNEKKKY